MCRDENTTPSEGDARIAPQDEIRHLLERVTKMVLDLVDKHGYSMPLCLGHSPTGRAIWIGADSSDPDATYDPQKSAMSILYTVRQMIGKGELRALAFARNLTCTISDDAGVRETAAVKVLLDHEAGGGYVAYVLYHVAEGKCVPDGMIDEKLEDRFFPTSAAKPKVAE